MFGLPLFPLNTVLFPGVPLHLHIFEDRYQRMIDLCLESNQEFGVVLIRRGSEAFGPLAETFPIGCTAQVVQVKPFEDGRMNITTLGKKRFRILSLEKTAEPYLIGRVVYYPLTNPDPETVNAAGARLRLWVDRYLSMLLDSGAMKIEIQKLPKPAIQLAYFAASLANISPVEKQHCLASSNAVELVNRLLSMYRREVALLKTMLLNREEGTGVFSSN